MTSARHAAAAVFVVPLAGKKYRAHYWTGDDYGDWDEYVISRMEERTERAARNASESAKERIWADFATRVQRFSFMQAASAEQLLTPTGIVKAWWLSLRHENPDLTEEDVFGLLNDDRTTAATIGNLKFIGATTKAPEKKTAAKAGTRATARKPDRKVKRKARRKTRSR